MGESVSATILWSYRPKRMGRTLRMHASYREDVEEVLAGSMGSKA